MGQSLTDRVEAIKNDDLENVLIAELNSSFDKFDHHFIPACKMTFTGSQTVASNDSTTQVTADYNNTLYDTYAARSEGPMADLSANKIVIRRDGIYVVMNAGGWNANATGVRRHDLWINGVDMQTEDRQAKASGNTTVQLTTVEKFVEGDELQIKLVQNSGVGLAVSANGVSRGCYFGVIWVGASDEV